MEKIKLIKTTVAPLIAVVWLAACGGGDSTPSYTITSSASTGGSISPAEMTVKEGESASFRVNPLTGYEINQVSGCNGDLKGQSYTINTVSQDCQVTASFERITFEVNTEFHYDGDPSSYYKLPTITPETLSVNHNEGQVFTLNLPDAHWSIQEVSGCPVDLINNYRDIEFTITTEPILEPCTLGIHFKVPDQNREFEIDTSITNGRAFLDGEPFEEATYRYGEQLTLEFVPYGERKIKRFGITSSGEGRVSCSFQREGYFVNLTVSSDCSVHVDFLADEEHYFPDTRLMQAFRNALELEPEEFLTEDLVASVESINLPQQHSSIGLGGIEAASSLKTLSLKNFHSSFNPLGLQPLAELSLEALHIEFNSIYTEHGNLEHLANLPLKDLSLIYFNAEPDDYQVLNQLTSLEYLDLSFNRQLHQIDFVENMPYLYGAYFNQTGVLDIRPILQSGITHGNDNSYFHVGGCASIEQPVTREVQAELEQKGVYTSVGSSSNWELCPSATDYYEGSLVASQEDRTLTLDLDINTDVSECTLYFNLHSQQPRVIDAIIEQCGTTKAITVDVELDIQKVDIAIQDGLFINPVMFASAQVDDSLNDSSQLRLAAVDWGQSTFKANPYLVPGRSALLRAHLIADGNPAAPTLDARLYLNGETQDLTLKSPQSIPSAPVFDSLEASYQLEMPADWMEEGLQVELRMDGQLIHTNTPTFADPTTLYMTVVPMVVDGKEPAIPSDEALARTIKTYWPIGEVVIERRDPFVVDLPGGLLSAEELLYKLRDLHALEGAQHYYHGIFNLETLGAQGAAGVAFRPGLVGVTYDRASDIHETFAHELGHNFSVGHIDCGGPSGIEVHYPYAPDTIGSVGIDYDFSTIYSGDSAAEVMSYCRPSFVSDWVYEKAQDYLAVNPPLPFNAAQRFDAITLSQPVFSTYISGVIDQVQGNSKVLSYFELNQPAGRENYGPFIMIATNSRGEKFERRFAIEQTSESSSENNGYFNVRFPANDIREIQILQQGREILRTKL